MVQETSTPPAYSPLDGTWGRVYRRPGNGPTAAIFMDRDGVILEEVGYLHRVEDVRLMPGAADLLRAANDRGIPVVVVTNQAGVGRGLYDWPAFEAVVSRMNELTEAEDVRVDAVYACPFHPDAHTPFAHPSHPSRKPNPGMLIRAAADMNLELKRSWLIGDTIGDIEAGRSAGLAGAIHLLSGHGVRDRSAVRNVAAGTFHIAFADDLLDARRLIPILADPPPDPLDSAAPQEH